MTPLLIMCKLSSPKECRGFSHDRGIFEIGLAQILMTSPLSFLATVAIEVKDSDTAASTFSFIQPGGGGSHAC